MSSKEVIVTTPSDFEVQVVRAFAAPRQLVFEALSKPEFVRRWLLGPPGWSMPVCEIDMRVGGRYRYEWLNAGSGERFGMGGSFREVLAPERIVATELFDGGIMGPESLTTTTLAEAAGRTMLTMLMRYTSKEVRDAVLATGMADGMARSFEQLDVLLAPLG